MNIRVKLHILILYLATSTKTATQRIYKELKMIVHKQDTPSNDLGFYVKLEKLRSVYQWVRIR